MQVIVLIAQVLAPLLRAVFKIKSKAGNLNLT